MEELHELNERVRDPWKDFGRRRQAIDYGLARGEVFTGLIEVPIAKWTEAGMQEEVYLEPLWKRWRAKNRHKSCAGFARAEQVG